MRLFIGIEIEPDNGIRELGGELKRLGLRTVDEGVLHINLKFLGEVEAGRVDELKTALDSVKGFGGFEIKLKKVGAFPDDNFIRVIWIGVESDRIKALESLISSELERLGFNKERDYIPHVTLARVPKKTPGVRELLGEREFGTRTVSEVHLIKSTLGGSGPVYERVHSVRL